MSFLLLPSKVTSVHHVLSSASSHHVHKCLWASSRPPHQLISQSNILENAYNSLLNQPRVSFKFHFFVCVAKTKFSGLQDIFSTSRDYSSVNKRRKDDIPLTLFGTNKSFEYPAAL